MGLLRHQNAVRAVDIEGTPISSARLRVYHSGKDSLARIYADHNQRWSREFGPVFKVDQLVKEMIQNDETKEPFA